MKRISIQIFNHIYTINLHTFCCQRSMKKQNPLYLDHDIRLLVISEIGSCFLGVSSLIFWHLTRKELPFPMCSHTDRTFENWASTMTRPVRKKNLSNLFLCKSFLYWLFDNNLMGFGLSKTCHTGYLNWNWIK